MSYFSKEIAELLAEIEKLSANSSVLILLEGPLGVGKTTFVQEFIEKLGGANESVQSPTFLKVLEYKVPSFGKLVHMDTYRMDEAAELDHVFLGHQSSFLCGRVGGTMMMRARRVKRCCGCPAAK